MSRFERLVVVILSLNLVATLVAISLLSELSFSVSKFRRLFFVSEIEDLLRPKFLGPKNILEALKNDVSIIQSDVSEIQSVISNIESNVSEIQGDVSEVNWKTE